MKDLKKLDSWQIKKDRRFKQLTNSETKCLRK